MSALNTSINHEKSKWVCIDCGNDQETSDKCTNCSSFRVVLLSVVIQIFGPEWGKDFKT